MAKEVIYNIQVNASVTDLVKLNEEIEQLTKAQKELTTAKNKDNEAIEKNKQQLKALKDQYSAQTKEVQNQVKAQNGLLSVYEEESKKLNDLRKQLKDLILTEKGNTESTRKLAKEVNELDAKLKKVDATAGQYQRSVGNYEKGNMGLGKSFISAGLAATGVVGGFSLLFDAIKDGFKTMKQFEQANANLASILGKPRAEIKALTDDAITLGASSAFSASEVTNLQTELAKLGFTESEILNASEAVLNLAAATGSDLAQAAEVAGATVRQFGLDATETSRVTDVMAQSFNATALDMGTFQEAMKYVGPVAKSAGVSLETTTALLGQLSNAGIQGSNAGTALKRIFSELATNGKPVQQTLKDLATKNIGLAEAEKLVGKEAMASLLVLTDSVGTLDELTVSLENAGGAAETMAKEQMNTLEGKIKELGGAWESFILKVASGEGVISNMSKSMVDFATNAVIGLTAIDEKWDLFTNDLKDTKDATKDFLLIYGTLEETGKKVADVISETFKGLSDKDLFVESLKFDADIQMRPIELYKKRLTDAFVAQGESLEDATILTEYYFDKQVAKYKEAEKASTEKKDVVVANDEEEVKSKEKQTKAIIGLINNQNELLSRLRKQINEATTEEEIRALQDRVAHEEIVLQKMLNTYKKVSIEKIDIYKQTSKELNTIQQEEVSKEVLDFEQREYKKAEIWKQNRENLKEVSLQISQELADAEFEILNANLERQKKFAIDQLMIRDEREQDLLQSKLDKGLITQAEYENNRKALAQKTEEERIKLERDAFNKKKKLDTAQAIMNGALAVTKILATTPPAISPVLVAGAIASTAIQVATIQAQKFKRGGLIQGASHEQGGVPAIVNGKRPIEVEGGEVIINKKSASMFKKELSAINQAGGGVPIFAKGGLVPKYASGGLVKAGGETSTYDLDRQARMIINGINDKRVINVVSDTVSTYSKAKQIENSVSF